MDDVEKEEVARREALGYLGQAGVVVTPSEAEALEIADFGLGRPSASSACS